MKKFTTRVLALIVALSMLLVSTAFATERSAGTLTVGNFEITMGENALSLLCRPCGVSTSSVPSRWRDVRTCSASLRLASAR